MIFNGLSKSDLVVYNALVDLLTASQQPVSARTLADKTNYTERTILYVLARLVEWKFIDRRRDSTGRPYEYKLLDD